MKRFFLITALILTQTASAKKINEKWYVDNYCQQYFNGIKEYHFPNGKRVDCMTNEYAIEFGFAPHFFEDIGQSLYYAYMASKKPGIAFIARNKSDLETIEEIRNFCNDKGIKIWIISETRPQ